ncbi:hypothetical protein [Rhizobium aegyptiacum]|uniref:hypothetical protein n=1 Tax=Rhizobium aegyptiacum TaxID=1764550 RepID=UPI000A7C7707|nr:hypothetical protein [Rhizobium aegyptiacum]
MKTGPERIPLSERLKDRLASPAAPEAGSTPSTSTNFETDWSEALKRAQVTIETDIRSFTDANRQHLNEALATTEADVNRLRSMVQPFFLNMGAVTLLIVLLSFTASWFWAVLMIERAQNASLWQMGLQINQTGSGKVLTWDVNRLQLITCQAGTAKTPCLKIAQGD